MAQPSLRNCIGVLSGLALGGLMVSVMPTTARADLPPVEALSYIDLERYLGKWYEIASFPQRFTKNCVATTADYAALPNREVGVVNRCRKGSLTGELSQIHGRAWVTSAITDAILAVQFFWPFVGDYWILDLGRYYEWSLVGSPDRHSLWILSRTPQMDVQVLERIKASAARQGFDLSRLRMTLQPK